MLYIEMNLLLAFSLGVLVLFHALSLRIGFGSAALRLRVGQALLVGAIALPAALMVMPEEALLHPYARIYSSRDRRTQQISSLIVAAPRGNRADRENTPAPESLRIPREVSLAAECQLALIALASLAVYVARLLRLRRQLTTLPCIRAHGRVRVVACDEATTPYSAYLPFRAYVVVPAALLFQDAMRAQLRLALAHEIQHHRQRDTHALHAMEALRAFFFVNPAIHALIRLIHEEQEFACDEFLIGHRKISPRDYGSCLIEAAQTARGARFRLAGTASMAAGAEGSTLKRRIEMLFEYRSRPRSPWLHRTVVALLILAVGVVSYASKGVIQDRTLSLAEAQSLAQKASDGATIPMPVNELVLERLNRFVGTEQGQKFLRASLARMPRYREMIEHKLKTANLPLELLAVPILESGYQNEAISPYGSAGIWQFMAETARKYDLRVDSEIDERKNPVKETDAAIRLLTDLHQRFGDWHLAFKGYNEGGNRVQALIDKYGTRDPWALERIDTRESYLAGVTAMMIVLKNPDLVD